MNISTVIAETAKYLSKYSYTFNPEKTIDQYLRDIGKNSLRREIEEEVKKIYRDGVEFFT